VIIHKTELEALRAYLQTFSEVDRSALLLQTDGVAYDEIARVLKISLASAKVKVHRLRLKLAEWRANREPIDS
jgi:DNA-directed RNA polymerase specialized sigma24 family protein